MCVAEGRKWKERSEGVVRVKVNVNVNERVVDGDWPLSESVCVRSEQVVLGPFTLAGNRRGCVTRFVTRLLLQRLAIEDQDISPGCSR